MALFGELRQLKNNQVALTDRVTKLESTNEKLSEANPKRINYKTLEELEHLWVALDVMEREIDFDKSLIDNAKAHLFKARNPNNK